MAYEDYKRFANDLIYFVFNLYGVADCPSYKTFRQPNDKRKIYLFTEWSEIIIEKQFQEHDEKMRSITKKITGRSDFNEQNFIKAGKVLLLWQDQINPIFSAFYIKCAYIADLALLFYQNGFQRSPNFATKLIVPLVAQAQLNGILFVYDDVLRSTTIEIIIDLLFEYVQENRGATNSEIQKQQENALLAIDKFIRTPTEETFKNFENNLKDIDVNNISTLVSGEFLKVTLALCSCKLSKELFATIALYVANLI